MIRLLLGLFFFLINMSLNLFSNSEYYYGACDASATVLLDENMILVADDEDNLLRLYSIKRKGLPIKTFPLNKFLGLTKSSHPEADIEACTRVGNLIYWITSHGRSKKGKWRNSRYRLFATEFKKENGDYFFPIGFNKKKKLSKFFKDEKLSVVEKSKVMLLCNNNQIIWVIGMRQDSRYVPNECTNSISKISINHAIIKK